MKNVITIIAATAVSMQMYAQNVDEGVKMYQYERYETAKNILSSFADKDQLANYYYGLALIDLGEIEAAEKVFNKSDHYYNQAGKARILYLKNQPDEAQKILEAITDKAKRREWQKYKVAADAITYTKGGNTALAISWYLTAIEKNDKDADLQIALGDAYFKLVEGGGNAMVSYERAEEIGTNNSLALSRIGRLWYVAQQYDDALLAYNKAKEADPRNPLPYRDLANAYQAAGNYENALTNIEEYLAKSDQSVDNKITYANLLYDAKKFDLAQAKMEELIAEGHERAYMYRIIAYTAFEQGDVKKAEENLALFFNKAKEEELINNDYIYAAKIYSSLAKELTVVENNDDVADAQDEAAIENQAKVEDYNKLVEKNLAKIDLKTDKQKAVIYKELADFFKDIQDYNRAASYYKDIVELKDYEAQVLDYYYWGFWNFYAQNLDESLEAFEQMEKEFPNEGSALYWQARVKGAQDPEAKDNKAVTAYEKWLAFENENYNHADTELMTAYQYITFYHYNNDNKDNALKYARKIKEIETDNTFAQQIIDYFNQ